MTIPQAASYGLEEPDSPRPRKLSGQRQSGVLTERELEVAALVAQGCSDKEIAARLVVSPRTAQSHVRHILAMLGFDSRAQIAAWLGAP